MGIKEESEKFVEWVKTGNDATDAKADSFLDKIKASKWTAFILLGVVVLVILAWFVG